MGSRGDVIVQPCGEHVASYKKQAKVPPCGPPADAGEAVVITRRGEPFAELVPRCSVETLRVLRKESRS
jgi:hypothetical protein